MSNSKETDSSGAKYYPNQCENCGHRNPLGSSYCNECGNKLKKL